MMLCRLCQTCASFWRDPPAALPRWVRSHLEHCPACRAASASRAKFERALRATFTSARSAPGPDVEWAVLNRLRGQSKPAVVTAPNRWRLLLRVIAWPAVAAAAIFAATLWGPHLSLPGQPAGGTGAARSPAESEVAVLETLQLPTAAARDSLRAWRQVLGTPYETEWELAKKDGRRAVSMLVRSVVPDPTAEILLAQARTLFQPSSSGAATPVSPPPLE